MIGRIGDGVLDLEPVSRFPNGPVERADGLHWDFEALAENVLDGLAEAVRREAGIESIGIDSWAVDYGLLRDGRLLGSPYHYRDERSAAGVEAVHAVVPPAELFARTGLQHLPFNTVFQVNAEQQGELWDRASTLLLVPDLIAYLLTGTKAAELTNASTTALLDVGTGDWSPELLDRLDDEVVEDDHVSPVRLG